jgi:Rrf2 family protein
MRLSAQVDYALRAMLELAAAADPPIASEALARAQGIPAKFLEGILRDLRRAGLVRSRRGAVGGYLLAQPADRVSLADVIRAVQGELANVRGERPEDVAYDGVAGPLQHVWIALRASEREVLETVTLADVVNDALPNVVTRWTVVPESWE